MDLGLFLPNASRGFMISTTSPDYQPSFDKVFKVVAQAEAAGLDFCLSMAKLHGFGGPSGYWDSCLDSFTLIAGLLARTERIKLFATATILVMPPAIAARAAATMDSIAPGRFGINIVTGWQKAEYDTMDMWPGEAHFQRRYDYAAEYVKIMKELWATGRTSFDGEFFHMRDCEVFPLPLARIELVCAGQSDPGMRFACAQTDHIFLAMMGVNNPQSIKVPIARLNENAAAVGRAAGCLPLMMVCTDESREAAYARWAHYSAGTDYQALAYASGQASMDKAAAISEKSSAHQLVVSAEERNIDPATFTNTACMGMGVLVGSYADVAALLDEAASIPGVSGLMVALADWENDTEKFCKHVEPLMKSRASRRRAA